MTNQDRSKLVAIVTLLGECYRQTITKQTIIAYEMGLEDLEIGDIERAARQAMRQHKFMPTVFELRSLCGVLPAESRATLAWAAAKKAIRDFDYTYSVDFDDPIINATIRLMGGWEQFCNTPIGEKFDVWARKQFEETYIKLCGSINLSEDMTRSLPGFHERMNGANGQAMLAKNRMRVITGLSAQLKRILPSLLESKRIELLTGIGDMPSLTTEGK